MTNLQKAAYEYGLAMAQEKSASASGMPETLLKSIRDEVAFCGNELLDAAIDYFNDVYDGAEA